MNLMTPASAVTAAARIRSPEDRAAHTRAVCIFAAAGTILARLERGGTITTVHLREAMEAAFGGSDAQGLWSWKDGYEACEAAQVLFVRKYAAAMRDQAGSPAAMLSMIGRIAELLPTHTRRSEESQALQQFSTPLPLAYVAATAAGIRPGDVVLEPSAGTGMLAVFAQAAGAGVVLNEIAQTRQALLGLVFQESAIRHGTGTGSEVTITAHDAVSIDDRLDRAIAPSVILVNPPFSAALNVRGRVGDTDLRHVRSAYARLADGGRLVAVTGHNFAPERPGSGTPGSGTFMSETFEGAIRLSCAIEGAAYAKHGTSFATRLTVIDKVAATNAGQALAAPAGPVSVADLLGHVMELVPPRAGFTETAMPDPGCKQPARPAVASSRSATPRRNVATMATPARPAGPVATVQPLCDVSDAPELVCEAIPHDSEGGGDRQALTDSLYEGYRLQSFRIPGSQPHPTKLVQSAAMSSVAPPFPSYRPRLPGHIVTQGILSDAQLESVVQAGEAHSGHLGGVWIADETLDNLSAAHEDAQGAIAFRRGWFLGDGTGCGKGRQVAGIILDNWVRGRRKAVWVSRSDKLVEDARRDWEALGMEKLLVQPLSRFRQGEPVRMNEGIVFVTYATLRSAARAGKASRLDQITAWLKDDAANAGDFDGVIVFDECHALANAAGSRSGRGEAVASQQGRAGLRLQRALPDARVVYVSATGATDVRNLAYAERLGLWGGEDFPFANRSEFVAAIEAGGVAAMEVMSRDMKALGLYSARSLSYEGVEVEIVEHGLTPAQVEIYDACADAFQVIHRNLNAALEASGITSSTGTLNGQALSAARSAFESTKQRFFSHLLVSMKCNTLIASVEADIEAGHAAVIQLVSTGEAVLERKLAEIPADEWNDLVIDLSPREIVGSYLAHAFPTQLHEAYSDDEGNLHSRPVFDADGNPVECRRAVAARDAMIERLGTLDPVPCALDRIIHHFGTKAVAEVTGRSRRVVLEDDGRLCVESRGPSSNLSETQAFMDDDKRILVFSDAGGTGRSYHADRAAKNRRRRIHYLLEAGWKADTAIQGLGRSNRTNQVCPPLFRPVTSDVKAEKRFLSTIARRLDTLGAITRGQRQTGGQGMFRAQDNLEGDQARAALRQFWMLLYRGGVEGCSLQRFEEVTGLKLTNQGSLKEDLPAITTFLNRLLALPVALQDTLFATFGTLLDARVEAAVAAGTHDAGLETIRAVSLAVTDRRTVWRHDSGAQTHLLEIERRDRNAPPGVDDVLNHRDAVMLVNTRSGRAAVRTGAASVMLDDGSMERRFRLVRPMNRETVTALALDNSHWETADEAAFRAAWEKEVAEVPEFTTSTLHLVTGLLLPVWRRLPFDNARVYRLQTDDGERILGRVLKATEVEAFCSGMGMDARRISAHDAWDMVNEGQGCVHLVEGMSLRRVRVMNEVRIELVGFTSGMVDALKARGLFGEIISWKLRLFVPAGDRGRATFESLTGTWPLVRVVERAT